MNVDLVGNCMVESAVPTLAGCPFFFSSRLQYVNVCMCIVPVFEGNGMAFMHDNHFGPEVQFPVRCWDELLENLPGLVLGKRWLLALLASRHLFSGSGWCRHVCLIAWRKRSPAVLMCAICGSLGVPPFLVHLTGPAG